MGKTVLSPCGAASSLSNILAFIVRFASCRRPTSIHLFMKSKQKTEVILVVILMEYSSEGLTTVTCPLLSIYLNPWTLLDDRAYCEVSWKWFCVHSTKYCCSWTRFPFRIVSIRILQIILKLIIDESNNNILGVLQQVGVHQWHQ